MSSMPCMVQKKYYTKVRPATGLLAKIWQFMHRNPSLVNCLIPLTVHPSLILRLVMIRLVNAIGKNSI
jgi:hypothetical protein